MPSRNIPAYLLDARRRREGRAARSRQAAIRTPALEGLQWVDHPIIPPHAWFGYVEHVYAWLQGIVDQVYETVALFDGDGEGIVWSMRSLVEFSSLYVRGLLEPASASAIDLHRRAGDLRTQELLSMLHERISWLSFTVDSFDRRRPRAAR